jgi:RNA polymerase sigma factor (sigma-70 family)
VIVGDFLEYAPRLAVADERRFRALLLRIVENTLRDESDWYRAKRRDLARSVPLPSDTVLALDPPRRHEETPSSEAARAEESLWVRLALELLESEERRLIVLHDIEGRSLASIARELELSDDAVERRHRKAFARLTVEVKALRRGDIAPIRSDEEA